MSNSHPTERLTDPMGHYADIDFMLVPLIQALWDAGYDTIGCCQDLGGSAHASRDNDHWKGYALLELPVEDACRLIDTIKETPAFRRRMQWAAEGAWEMSCQLIPGSDEPSYLTPWVQIHFPNDQIDDLIQVLTAE